MGEICVTRIFYAGEAPCAYREMRHYNCNCLDSSDKKQSGSISTDAANSIWIVLFNDITRIFVWRSRKKNFSPCLSCFSARHWPPFSRALCDRTGFCRVSFSVDFPFNSLGAFFCRRFWQYFPPQIKKIYFICSKEGSE